MKINSTPMIYSAVSSYGCFLKEWPNKQERLVLSSEISSHRRKEKNEMTVLCALLLKTP